MIVNRSLEDAQRQVQSPSDIAQNIKDMLDQSAAEDLPNSDSLPKNLDDRRAILMRCHQHETFSESVCYGNEIKYDNDGEEEAPSNLTNHSMWEDEEEPIIGNEKLNIRRLGSPEDINTSDIPSLSSPDFK